MTSFFVDHSQEFLAKAENAVEKAIARGTIAVQSTAIKLVSQNSSSKGATPSAPGQPPHLDTGTLARSIDQETFRRGNEFIGRVGTNLDYGLFLEIGTSKMSMRPYLRPALEMNRRKIMQEIKKAGASIRIRTR